MQIQRWRKIFHLHNVWLGRNVGNQSRTVEVKCLVMQIIKEEFQKQAVATKKHPIKSNKLFISRITGPSAMMWTYGLQALTSSPFH